MPKSNGPNDDVPKGYRVVYTPYIRRKDGTIVYPKRAKVFRFLVKDE